MIVDRWKACDLTEDKKWIAARQYANIRGEKNPILSGALVIYDGVVLHQCNRVIRTKTGSGGTKIGHALFKYDGENLTDFGCINVLTASEDELNKFKAVR